MQALILAGGQGTRLRPLTLALPKPVVPLAGRPFISFMLDWLRGHGVSDVVLSCGFLSDAVHAALGDEYRGMRLDYLIENEPLGTAGPIRLAHDQGLLEDRFLVLNGDCLCDIDLTAQMAQHELTAARATIALVEVDDTASFGVVPTARDNRVEAFLEKSPGPAPTNRINAGAYMLDHTVVGLIDRGRAVSIEREVFPELVGRGLFGYMADAYWMDVGTPERYRAATVDLLLGRVASSLPERDGTNSLIHHDCATDGARIGPLSVLGSGCAVGPASVVEHSVLHDGVAVGRDCLISGGILADGVRVGDRAIVNPFAIV